MERHLIKYSEKSLIWSACHLRFVGSTYFGIILYMYIAIDFLLGT